MVLELFFVMLDLLLDPLGGQIERVMHIAVLVGRDELVLVFGMGDDLDKRLALPFAVEIDRDHDGGQSVEVMQEFLGLLLEQLVSVVGQEPVPG